MLRLRSHGKINWHLEVVRRLPDGYHELRTLFQTIDLADDLTLRSSTAAPTFRVSHMTLAGTSK